MVDVVRLLDPAGNEVKFNLTPNVSESKSAIIIDKEIPDAAGFVIYKATGNRKFQITGTFVARNSEEVTDNNFKLYTLRSWLIPEKDAAGKSEPHILQLWGYGSTFKGIPVVLQNYNIVYPEDVDYLSGEAGITIEKPVLPIVHQVSVSLIESHSNADIKAFNIEDFRTGRLRGW